MICHELGHNWNAGHCNSSTPCHIMCSTINGCNGQGLPNFEPQGALAVRNFAASRSCLASVTTAIDVALPSEDLRLDAPWPTPFRDVVSLRYYVDRTQLVRLGVYDAAGRRVASLVDRVEEAGWHTATWNGLREDGVRIEPGVLFARLVSGREVRTRNIIVLRP